AEPEPPRPNAVAESRRKAGSPSQKCDVTRRGPAEICPVMTNVSGGGYGQQRPERREHAADAVGGRTAMQRNGNPRVSVVVPTRNEARNLEVVLPAIAAVRP